MKENKGKKGEGEVDEKENSVRRKTRQNTMGEEVKWVRKATELEIMFNKNGQSGKLLVIYRMSLCTRHPLQPQQVKEALSLLYRKSPNLRVCLAEWDGEAWFKEMASENIDFEVSAADVDKVTDVLQTQRYHKDGPLWRVRLVLEPAPCYHPQRLACFHDDLQETFPHCYYLLFGFSHAIGDGHTYAMICAGFTHILDHILAGEEVDEKQIGSFDLNEEYDTKSRECLSRFYKDEAWRNECIGKQHKRKSIVSRILSPSEDRPKKTLLYTQTLDQKTTARLLELCRAAKVTMSSCVAAAGNLAMVDMLVEKGVMQDTYSISNIHMINMRRTWSKKGTTEHAFGCYLSLSRVHSFQTPHVSERGQFWQYARDIHGKFHGFLNEDQFMDKAMLFLWCHITGNTHYLATDLRYNNLGDLTQKFEGTKEVTVTNLLSSTSIHNPNIAWYHMFGTVRGRLSHSIKYNSGLVSEDTAVKYGDLVYARLMKVATP